MAQVTIKQRAGGDAGSVDLDDAIFGIEPNVPVMHQVVTAQLAARRAGTQSTKTRAEVRGGGAKPWKQKGTGRARQGSIRSPALGRRRRGPRPEAPHLRPAHPQEDDPPRPALGPVRPRRRGQGHRRRRLGLRRPPHQGRHRRPGRRSASTGKVLVVLDDDDTTAWKSFRNLTDVHIIEAGELNAYDVLVSDFVVFTHSTLPSADGEAPARPKVARARGARSSRAGRSHLRCHGG